MSCSPPSQLLGSCHSYLSPLLQIGIVRLGETNSVSEVDREVMLQVCLAPNPVLSLSCNLLIRLSELPGFVFRLKS